ncbi:MAG: hypothetical protein M1814_001337 [Vezdaea aestivalis]|nr:MAG: hypothetical protein M1814_001337 [Vezdaea aestivalis]
MTSPQSGGIGSTEATVQTPEPDFPTIVADDINIVYQPPANRSVIADVVFVHGLMGHPVHSWAHGDVDEVAKTNTLAKVFRRKGKKKQTGQLGKGSSFCFWPYHLLPASFQDLRILTYGYDSNPTHWYKSKTSRITITQHAQLLRDRVTRERLHCRERSSIFVAHSLGGILVKDAIIQSAEMKHQPDVLDLALSCRNIFFFATPHLGLGPATWGSTMSSILGAIPGGPSTYGEILRGLSPDSETLDNITKRFNRLLDDKSVPDFKRIQICSMQESSGPGHFKGIGSKVSAINKLCIRPYGLIYNWQTVPDSSSQLYREEIEKCFVLKGSHTDLCKFPNANCAGYKDFEYVLSLYLRDIKERGNSIQQPIQKRVSPAKATQENEIANLFNFDTRLTRTRQLSQAVSFEESFEWIWSSTFVSWIELSDQKPFWILGHPGSGKSTLVNYIAESTDRLNKMLVEAHGQTFCITSFFFDYRAREGIQNTFQGLRRSLLFQLLRRQIAVASEVKERFDLEISDRCDWLDDDVKLDSILKFVLSTLKQPILLFIDGLDEYAGDKPDLLALIEMFVTAGVKLCVASRDESPFSSAARNVQSFRMDHVNGQSILSYASALLTLSLEKNTADQRRLITSLSKDIVSKSRGIFLWARFATMTIIDAKTSGVDDAELKERLEELPKGLSDIYTRIFKSKRQKDRHKIGLLLRLITTARSGVLLVELFEACHLAKVRLRQSAGPVTSNELEEFKKFILSLGGGLIEIPHSGLTDLLGLRYSFVTVIHHSVQVYLDDLRWAFLSSDVEDNRYADLPWLQVCAAYEDQQKMDWTHPTVSQQWRVWRSSKTAGSLELRLLPTGEGFVKASAGDCLPSYVRLNLLHHAFQYERQSGKSCMHFISMAIGSARLDAHHNAFETVDVPFGSFQVPCCRLQGLIGPAHLLMFEDNPPIARVKHSDLIVAITHKLSLFVKESVSVKIEQTGTPDISGHSDPNESGRKSDDAAFDMQDLKYMALLALLCHSFKPEPERLEIVEHLSSVFSSSTQPIPCERLTIMNPLQCSPFFSTTTQRPPITPSKDWNYIDSWLRLKLNGKTAPPFERNPETLKALLALAAQNELADDEATHLESLKRQTLAVYRTPPSERALVLLTTLRTHLSSSGSNALTNLALSSQALQNPRCTELSLAAAISAQTLHSQLLTQQLRRLETLQKSLKRKLFMVQNMYDNATDSRIVVPEELEKVTAERRKAIKMLGLKVKEYRDRIEDLPEMPEVSVEGLVEREDEVRVVRERVRVVEEKLKVFGDLPVEKPVAKEEVERVKELVRRLERQRDELFEGLVEGERSGV